MIYDQGTYSSEDLNSKINKGHFKFVLNGKKISGSFNLVRIKGEDWIITSDQDIEPIVDPLREVSALSGKTMAEINLGKKLDLKPIALAPIKKLTNIRPMLCETAEKIFDSRDFIYEPKLDGYRAIAELESGSVNLYSRNLQQLKDKFKIVYDELKKFKFNAVFDGEIVYLGPTGIPEFSKLQNVDSVSPNLFYYVFDLLSFEGHDLTGINILERKKLLKKIIPNNRLIRFTPFIAEKGTEYFDSLRKNGFEGIIAKKNDSLYKIGTRSRNWLKIKSTPEIEAVVVGYTAPQKSREFFGSLVLAEERNGNLYYIGNVGTGFDDRTLKKIYKMLQDIKSPKQLFNLKNVTWVEPQLIARVKYLEKTSLGQLRHPSFIGILEDREYIRPTLDLQKNRGISP